MHEYIKVRSPFTVSYTFWIVFISLSLIRMRFCNFYMELQAILRMKLWRLRKDKIQKKIVLFNFKLNWSGRLQFFFVFSSCLFAIETDFNLVHYFVPYFYHRTSSEEKKNIFWINIIKCRFRRIEWPEVNYYFQIIMMWYRFSQHFRFNCAFQPKTQWLIDTFNVRIHQYIFGITLMTHS